MLPSRVLPALAIGSVCTGRRQREFSTGDQQLAAAGSGSHILCIDLRTSKPQLQGEVRRATSHTADTSMLRAWNGLHSCLNYRFCFQVCSPWATTTASGRAWSRTWAQAVLHVVARAEGHAQEVSQCSGDAVREGILLSRQPLSLKEDAEHNCGQLQARVADVEREVYMSVLATDCGPNTGQPS